MDGADELSWLLDFVEVVLGPLGLEPDPAGGGGGVPGNTIGPPVGTCDAHRRFPRTIYELDSRTVGIIKMGLPVLSVTALDIALRIVILVVYMYCIV